MKIKDKLEILYHYYITTRQVGHSTLLKTGLDNYENKKFVLAYSKSDNVFLKCKPNEIISWVDLNLGSLIGFDRPLIIDNGVMDVLLRETLNYIESLEEDRETLNKIKNIIKNENKFS